MATISFKFTNSSPGVLIGGKSIRFVRLAVKSGDINDIYFDFCWTKPDKLNPGQTSIFCKNFTPSSYLHPYQSFSTGNYEFRNYENFQPSIDFEEDSAAVNMISKSTAGKVFEFTVEVEITY